MQKVFGIYKPLNNKKIDEYLNRKRARWGNNLVSMSQTGRALIENRKKPCIFVFIADQTPSDIQNAHWHTFLNQDTPFHHGPDKIARQTGYPVFFCNISRPVRGVYEMSFTKITDGLQPVEPEFVTQQFAQHLEKLIQQNPVYWLWSHRRWKRSRQK
jgi:KDO2-lipid IV(A) lauroyltransferase